MHTVLLVEDDPDVRIVIRRMLVMHGLCVLEAANGCEALHVASSHNGAIHVLVTDVVLPKMGSEGWLDRIATDRAGLKVIYISGHTPEILSRHGMSGTESNFLQKPFTFQALGLKIAEALALCDPLDSKFSKRLTAWG